MRHIASCRTGRKPFAIYKEFIPVIARYTHDKLPGFDSQHELFSEMIDAIGLRIRSRMKDPTRLAVAGMNGEKQQEKNEGLFGQGNRRHIFRLAFNSSSHRSSRGSNDS